jgi:hypothetical protein
MPEGMSLETRPIPIQKKKNTQYHISAATKGQSPLAIFIGNHLQKKMNLSS